MALRVHNSLTRSLERFEPAQPDVVTVYACGPTVYAPVHIGNWSSFIFYDVLVRWLRESGWTVRFVQNVTDVDDKIIRDAAQAGETRERFTERWTKAYFDDMARIGCVRPDQNPRATDHVPGMVRMIQRLLDRGHAYLADDGSVYFRIASFPHYGQLKQLSADSVRTGASGRVRADEYEKESVGDFALWKAWDPADGNVVWDATFTIDGAERAVRGRPGWHIECSVMSTEILGDQIDVHLGGEDLLFPHHENEIAQSEGATGVRPFVRYWMHRRHLLVDGAKMSKSKRNFFRISDIEERTGAAGVRGFRYLVTTTHYRSPIDFTWRALDAAVRTLRNLEDAVRRLEAVAAGATPSDFAAPWGAAFAAAMDDDLETSGAIAAVHEMMRECNRRADAKGLTPADAASALALVERADRTLGLMLERGPVEVPADARRLLDERSAARAAGDFARSDRLRDELLRLGWAVKDGPGGRQDVSRSG